MIEEVLNRNLRQMEKSGGEITTLYQETQQALALIQDIREQMSGELKAALNAYDSIAGTLRGTIEHHEKLFTIKEAAALLNKIMGEEMTDENTQVWQTLQARQDAQNELQGAWKIIHEALEFYAAPDSWEAKGHPQIDADAVEVKIDMGAIARKALALMEAIERAVPEELEEEIKAHDKYNYGGITPMAKAAKLLNTIMGDRG